MAAVHRAGDANTAGGRLTTVGIRVLQDDVFANRRLISVDGSQGTADAFCNFGGGRDNGHCGDFDPGPWSTNNGCPTVFINKIPINRAGDLDTCGHARGENASPNVFICAVSEAGTMIDNNAPLFGNPPAALEPLADTIPLGGQPFPGKPNYTDITRADIAIYDDNLDDPDGSLGTMPANTRIKPGVEEIRRDLVGLGSPVVTPVQDCSTFDALLPTFNWINVAGSPAFVAWAASTALSPNFFVSDLTVDTAVSYYEFTIDVTQTSGVSQKRILQNMCYLAKTVLEPLLADSRIPTFTITSAFRNKSGGSQHNIGQAVDLQFTSLHDRNNTGARYYNLARYIRDNFDYDQLILEWFGRNPWIHISTDSFGHRGSVLTQTSPTTYAPGIRQLA